MTHLRHIVTGVHSSSLGIDSTHLSLIVTDRVKVSTVATGLKLDSKEQIHVV